MVLLGIHISSHKRNTFKGVFVLVNYVLLTALGFSVTDTVTHKSTS